MNYYIVSIYDSAVAAFGRPAFTRSKNDALRAFTDELNRAPTQEPNPLQQHPADYSIYFVGTFDDQQGRFESPAQPELLAHASDLLTTK